MKLKIISSILVAFLFLVIACTSGQTKQFKSNEKRNGNAIKTTFKDADELFNYVTNGYFRYIDLVEQWGDAELGKPYLNESNEGFNVQAKWEHITVEGSIPVFEFSVSESDNKTPISFKGFILNEYIYKY